MEIAEQVYEQKSPPKTFIRSDANRDSHVTKQKWGEAASPINPEKGRSGKRKKINSVSPRENMTSAEKTRLLHVPIHLSEECKSLKEYSKKYTAQRPNKNNEARSGGKKKRGKSFEFDSSIN